MLKIGLIGLGTVGCGVYKTLKNFSDVEILKIAVRDKSKNRKLEGLSVEKLTEDAFEIVNNPDVDVVVELMGGVKPAYDLVKTAILNNKHVVTANKELLAKYGEELFTLAEEHNRVVLYEAAIAGGIPLIMPIKTILAGNKINRIEAILNGTTNYILSKMDSDGASYDDVLKEAQELGYAEADPTSDVEGFDSAYKLTTLATVAFNKRVKLENVYREGITKVSAEDISVANELGYKIKLVAHAEIDNDNNADVRVHPMFVSKKETLAHINYVTNAVSITGYPVGTITLSGAGAGELPTASSVVGDILAIAREFGTTDYLLPMMRCKHCSDVNPIDISQITSRYYVNASATDKIGGISFITSVFAKNEINISSVLMRGIPEDKNVKVVLVTELTKEYKIKQTLDELLKAVYIDNVNSMIRIAG